MKKNLLVLEHGNMMFHSREIIQLKIPKELNLMFYSILVLVIGILVLISTLKINDVIKVAGIVKTQTNNSVVKNILPGEIQKINYDVEQYVEKGEILYSLKDEVFSTHLCDLNNEIKTKTEELYCLNTLLEGINCGQMNHVDKENLFVYSQLNEYFETIGYLEKQIEILKYRYLQEVRQPEILYNRRNVDEAKMNLELNQQELEKYKAGFLANIVQRKKDCELILAKLNQELIRVKEEFSFLEVLAPVSGFVQEISRLNVGDYVFPNQEILMIVPDDAKNYKVELAVFPKDIGKITTGMEVKYRLSAFPFFEFKGADGIIESIDSDVRQSDGSRGYYRVCSDINRTSFISNKGIEYPLRAGIEVDARIILEKISVVHFILRKLDFAK